MPTATATIEEVYAPNRGGFFDIKLADGTKLSTKKADLAEAAKALKGRTALIEYTERQNGQYVNRYLDAVQAAGTLNGSGYAQAEVTDNDVRIMRQAAMKCAVRVQLPPEEATPQGLVEVAEFFLDYFTNGPSPDARVPGQDDSIPF